MGENIDPIDELLDDVESGSTLILNRDVLHYTHMPNVVLHRDDEQRQVTQSLAPIIKGSRPSNILVYGKPGTGKTLIVRRIILKIQERVRKSTFPIRLVYTNSKEESTLYGLLVSLGRQMGMNEKELPWTGISISEIFRRILHRVEESKANVVLVIDEVDFLARLISGGHKDVLYNITRANERLLAGSLTLVGISNDLTFKEILDPRVISSLGEEEIVFPNYSMEQLRAIIDERVQVAFKPGAVEESALSLCAALAGQEHGDARRAIDLLRVAGEMAERTQDVSVSQEHVRAAYQKIEEDKEVTAIRSYPLHEKLLILAVMQADGAITGKIYSTYKELCRRVGQKELTQRRMTQMLSEVEMSGIISGRIVHQGSHGRTKKFKLNITPDLVQKTLENDSILGDFV